MVTFASCGIAAETPPDPTKHVCYTPGMVLGVDDFTQEFAYLHGRDTWLARDALGYGTLLGLAVAFDRNDADALQRGPRVTVSPGVALLPSGELVQVATAQCAYVNAWLAARSDQPFADFGSPPSPPANVALYVVLRYRACPTDDQPIPGEPCRTEAQLTAPSRWADDFLLELRLTPPEHREEAAVRDFVAWLGQVEIDDVPHSEPILAGFLAAIRAQASVESPPVGSPPLASPPIGEPLPEDFMEMSPPASLVIPVSHATEYLRAAFRLWTTELRPAWRDLGRLRPGDPPQEDVLLLAELRVPTMLGSDAEGHEIVTLDPALLDQVEIDEERRPYLLSLRLIQEWLLSHGHRVVSGGGGDGPALGNTVTAEQGFGLSPAAGGAATASRADHTHGTPPVPTLAGDVTGNTGAATVVALRGVAIAAAAPTAGQVLRFVSGSWQPGDVPVQPAASLGNSVAAERVFGLPPVAGAAATASRSDHTHGTPDDPIPAHRTAVDAHTLAGDVTGAIGATRVVRLQGRPVAATGPADGQVLRFANGSWQPANLPEPPPPPPVADVVVHPSEVGDYLIVAAGNFRFRFAGNGRSGLLIPINAPYNALRGSPDQDRSLGPNHGQVNLTFDGYSQPSDNEPTRAYIVKALPWPTGESALDFGSAFVVGFSRFDAESFALTIFPLEFNREAPLDDFEGSLMVEVSEYRARG
jgi:hypothetical protein